MAGFKTHVTTSTVLGIGYGAAGFLVFDMPIESSILAAGLCGVSGMLPDMDSESGTPVREGSAFAAAVVPMLMIGRFQNLGWTPETMVLVGGAIYLAVRWALPYLLGKFSVHRGMWHSLPAAAIAGMVALLLCSCPEPWAQYYKAGAVVLGYLSHLALDELYSIQWSGGRVRLKRSSGTALKFFSKSGWANFSTYAKLAALGVLVAGDPIIMQNMGEPHPHAHPSVNVANEHDELFDGLQR